MKKWLTPALAVIAVIAVICAGVFSSQANSQKSQVADLTAKVGALTTELDQAKADAASAKTSLEEAQAAAAEAEAAKGEAEAAAAAAAAEAEAAKAEAEAAKAEAEAAKAAAKPAEAAPAEGIPHDGTFTAEAQGFGGPVSVEITVEGGAITGVAITGENETPTLGGVAVDTMDDAILAAGTPNVDGVAGATVTSTAIRAAATEALTAAGADIAALDENRKDAAEETAREEKELSCDVVVVGAGGAGMSAAITVHEAGLSVIILEKMAYVGGNTTKATGGMNAAETHYQAEAGITDSVQQFVDDTMAGGHNINNPDLVRTMAERSAAGIDWLDSIGAPLPKVSFSGGATNARIHAPADGTGVGEYLVEAFSKKLSELGIEPMLNTKATELLVEDGKVVGVKAESKDADYTIRAKSVILASGGFGANEEMYCQYRPDLRGTVTTNAPGATGDDIIMAQAVGADLVDIEQIQLHPTVEQTTSMLITESVRGDGAILVNQNGERFINELLTRDVVSAGELAQPGCYAYIIFDQRLRDGLKAIEKYVKNGLTVQADTPEELAEKIGCDPAVFAKTLADWNGYVAAKNDEAFGRTTGMDKDLSVAPYYAIKIAPGIHHTMGGIKIDTLTHVIDKEGNIIPNLYAAGEVTGGVHGGNRIGGNAVADIVVFGRLAGEQACENAK